MLFLVKIIILITFSNFLNPISGNTELRALLDIKSSLDPQNNYLSSWTSDGDPCGGTFVGVACNEHRKVANISLQGKGLAGKLSPAVAELKCLSGLYLHYNSLSGEIPEEIGSLTELTDLYLNINNFSGSIPPMIHTMTSLHVLQLCCNQLTGSIPTEMGLLKNLGFITLNSNKLTGKIPASLGELGMLNRLNLSFNQLSGPIPLGLANNPSLKILDVQNNTLSGVVPSGLKRLNEGFLFSNNPGLCGTGISSLRTCTAWDNLNNQIDSVTNKTISRNMPQPASIPLLPHSSSKKLPQIAIVAGVITLTITLTVVIFALTFRYRRQKQKVGNKSDTASHDRVSSIDRLTDFSKRSRVVSVDTYASACEFLPVGFKCNMEDVESATQHFSEMNLLGKSKFSSVHKGILKDGTVVAVKSVNQTSCKSEKGEFMRGLSLLNSLKHENLVTLKGFCCSKARGECFLIYEFGCKGNLSQYLDDDCKSVLDWPTRVFIINGIAKGISYLHSSEPNRPPIIHQNISVEKVVLDQQLKPLILDSGLLKLLADDVVYSALKVSAALGYMAPEYINTGRFTEKSDVYAFGVIILQVLSGKCILSGSVRLAAETGKWEDFIDSKLEGKFSENEAGRLTKVALECTSEDPDIRPSMGVVVQELNDPSDS